MTILSFPETYIS